MIELRHDELRLRPEPGRVVVRPFHLAWNARSGDQSRTAALIQQVRAMDMRTARAELALVMRDFEARHWQTEKIFLARYDELEAQLGLDGRAIRREKKLLIGAYFCHEYSYAAAALMNPSATRHPDQSGLSRGAVRFIMSLRAVGEGHISSIAFREGIVTPDLNVQLMPEPPFATAANSTAVEADRDSGPVTVTRNPDSSLSGTVLFPITVAQRNGLEDLRLTEFTHDDGRREWIGTYTAYSGAQIQSELLRTLDFQNFLLAPMTGPAARNKGMALFPRKIGGRYQMIGRQDGKNLFLLSSDELGHWDDGTLLLEPVYPWELVQIGNCGAPIEIDEGWLLLTHGVGAMRKYAIGAALLDKDDPSKVLGRTPQPILSAADEDRDGYVPNVVYTCGALRAGDQLFLPYGVADMTVAFAFVSISELVATMVPAP
ncbi:glycoside hydrolase family 130 protein [Allosphingosinicella sp.]|uniref:glycoside hydrolase family 130 protein n=1 Tax=Allosphingosinicella sp. TaxID=2823234 RepID=UPI003784C163